MSDPAPMPRPAEAPESGQAAETGGRTGDGSSSPPRLLIAIVVAAIALTLAVVATGLVLASQVGNEAAGPDTGPVAVPAVPSPGAAGRHCAAVMTALPDSLVDLPRRAVTGEAAGVAAWGDPPVILRCGLPDPAELTCAAALTTFTSADGTSVTWLRLSDSSAVTYLAVDRPVRIAVTLAPGVGVAPIQQLSEVIGAALPAQPVCTAGAVTPADNS